MPAPLVIHLIKATGIAGAERHLLDLLPALRARGCDARLRVLLEPRRPVSELFAAARRAGIPAERATIRADCDPLLRIRLASAFRREQPQIVHTHLIHADFHGIPAARQARVPTVITTRHDENDFRRRAPLRLINRWLWQRVDAGIAVSEALAHFSRNIEGARRPIRVVQHGIPAMPNGDSQAARRALGLAPDGLAVGIVGRLIEQKGIADAIDAFARVAPGRAGVELLIAGEGPARRALERRAATSPSGERVRFLGWRSDRQAVMCALDLLMAPSLREGFGLAVLEAMALGIPVIATRVGGLSELVAEGETGLLVPPADPPALAAALHRMLEDPALRRRLGEAGRARARRDFTIGRMAEETLAVYREFSGAGPGRR